MSDWIEITDDPATLPEPYSFVAIRTVEGFEFLSTLEAEPEIYLDRCWSKVVNPYWHSDKQCIVFDREDLEPREWNVTHWRPIK